MRKTLKKWLSSVIAFAIVSSLLAIPVSAENSSDDVLNTWKFDFGTAENVEDGYYAVTKDTHYNTNIVDGLQFGLLGTNENDYKLEAYVDGIEQQQGQVIVLKEGSKETVETASDDYIGNAPQEEANYKVPGVYPVRFSMKGTNDSYYRVIVELTTLDRTQDAVATVTSERRRAIIMEETIPAGETKEVTFTATIQNNYYKGPAITYQDNMLNVVAMGDNLAVSQIIVNEVTPKPTVWMYDDSTGCDYNAILPYFPLQNYGGTGQFLPKYLPVDIAVSNQGEGGLNAADNMHWGCAKGNIGAGDYVYVQYGHNHKDGGPLEYLQCIPKYYEYASSVGAYTIYAGPIDRHNDSQFDASTNTWNSTLSGFSKAAKYYTEILITGGKAKADEFIQKAKSAATGTGIEASVYAWADAVIAAGITDAGAKDVAFIDLNQPTLDWLEQVCEDVKTIRGSEVYEKNATDYYFRVAKGTSVDGTHPNDAGADNTASFFFDEAKKVIADTENGISVVQAEILAPLVTDMREATPYVVSEEIIKSGYAGGAGWPDLYVPDNLPALPTEIKSVTFNEDGTVASAVVETRAAKLEMSAYGIVEITINNPDGAEKGKLYAVDQIDNTVIGGTQTVTAFRGDVTLGEDDTYTAIVWKAVDSDGGLIVDEEMIAYSAVYVPTDIEAHLITDEDGNGTEDFDYYGAIYTGDEVSDVSAYNGWIVGGSSSKTTTLGVDGNRHYANFIASNGNSAYVMKKFNSTVGTTGRYMLEADLQYVSGSGMKVTFAGGIKNSSPFASDEILLYTVGTNGSIMVNGTEAGALNTNSWATVRAILDMDAGTVSVSVAGGTPVVAEISNYAKFTSDIAPASLAGVSFNGSKADTGIRISNLTAAKLYDDKAKTTMTVSVGDGQDAMGTVSVGNDGAASVSVLNGTTVTAKAVANEGHVFKGWFDNGVEFSKEEELSLRLYRDFALTAEFAVATTPATVTVNYVDEAGKAIKNAETITEFDGDIIRTGDEFVLPGDKTAAIKVANGDLFEVYTYDSSKSDSLTIASLAETNTINLVFAKQSGYYYIYEDFSTVTDDWGFVEGRAGNVNVLTDGTLQIYAGSGTSASQQTADVKTLDSSIQSVKKMTIGFDWTSGAGGNGRYSSFDLTDSAGNVIFSLCGRSGAGIYYALNETADNGDTTVSSSNTNWVRVSLDVDFEAMKLSGTVTNLSTGTVYTVAETTITATNLAVMKTTYGYSAAPQALDNVWIKVDATPEKPVMPGMAYADGVLTITTDKAYDTVNAYVASYNGDGSLNSVTVTTVTDIKAEVAKPVELSAETGNKIMLWDGMSNIFDALSVTE